MYYIKKLSVLALVFISFKSISQNNFNTLGESAIDLNHRASQKYNVNFALRSRYFLYNNEQVLYKQQQIDIIHFSTFKLTYSHNLSFGLQYRNRGWFNNSSNEIRLTQQFNYAARKRSIRYGHRFRTEQRILESKTIFRPRYRFAIDLPLNGEKLDIGEAYFVGALESLLSVSKVDKPEIDQRGTFQIGFQINENMKLQTGLEYRLEAFNFKTEHVMFLLTSVIYKI